MCFSTMVSVNPKNVIQLLYDMYVDREMEPTDVTIHETALANHLKGKWTTR